MCGHVSRGGCRGARVSGARTDICARAATFLALRFWYYPVTVHQQAQAPRTNAQSALLLVAERSNRGRQKKAAQISRSEGRISACARRERRSVGCRLQSLKSGASDDLSVPFLLLDLFGRASCRRRSKLRRACCRPRGRHGRRNGRAMAVLRVTGVLRHTISTAL